MKSGRCVKCGHDEIILAEPAEYADGGNEMQDAMALTADPRWVLKGRNPRHPHGKLVCLACRKCGYTEWYTIDPESVPIGAEYRTQLLGGGSTDRDE